MDLFTSIWRKKMRRFEPLDFPLDGQRLIEASAGTGKTFSIALLFLRLLLESRIDVDRILVITFTTAATEELRSRIAARLREIADFLDQLAVDAEFEPQETILADLLAGIEDRQEASRRIADALARMDEAAVYTIHGFCQRMLQENAFESGALFELEFLESEKPLRREIIEDFWRQRFYASPLEEVEWAIAEWNDPAGLEKCIGGMLAKPVAEYVPSVTLQELQQAKDRAEESYRSIIDLWRECREDVENILRFDKNLSSSRKDGYGPERVGRILSWLAAKGNQDQMPWLLPKELALLGSSVMRTKLVHKRIFPEHIFFDQFDAFLRIHTDFLRTARIHTLTAACRFISTEMTQRKNANAKIFYDDLLRKLDRALSGREASNLRQRIRSRFAVALIDEFQDTDPVQYRIVRKLFGSGPESSLIMVGDPKQSIYSFRGADIFTYMRARRDTPEQSRFTMETNYRSTEAMVRAVNILFDRHDAFIFAPDIVFRPVKAGGKAEDRPLLIEERNPRPLQAMFIPGSAHSGKTSSGFPKTKAEEIATRWSAYEIARLLSSGAQGKASIGGLSLTGGDVAVLVRTHFEANLMQQALGSLNIPSVYYSQDSVFETDEAAQLYRVLISVLDGADERAFRRALITDLFGYNGTDLHQLLSDDAAREQLFVQWHEYRSRWQNEGLSAMFQMLLARRRVVQRILARPAGERKITNYLHLIELLQEESGRLDGPDSLLRWFGEQMNNPEPEKANQQLRLESDENLVKIITVHKAKGLEFPIVFLPYLWRTRPVAPDGIFTFHHPDSDKAVADLGSGDPGHYRLAERERLAEDLRLLYVAITRAKHMCCFCWGRIKDMDKTPLAWLLHRGGGPDVPPVKSLDERRVLDELSALNRSGHIMDYLEYPSDFKRNFVPPDRVKQILLPRIFTGTIDTGWAVTSYSQLAAKTSTGERQIDFQPEEAKEDRESENCSSVFDFPRGAAAGNCLHGLLEQIDFVNLQEKGLPETVDQHLVKTGIDSKWNPLVCQWLQDIVGTPLSAVTDMRLARVGKMERIVELGFYFSLHDMQIGKINSVLRDYSIPAIDSSLHFTQGLMKGFIDLVFRFDDRFYIADYKSNYLGPTLEDYREDELSAAMISHRYDLQYLIYTVALHRYLETRIKGYRYDSHFGGVYYLFLRGMNQAHGPRYGVFSTRPPESLVDRLDECFGCPEAGDAKTS